MNPQHYATYNPQQQQQQQFYAGNLGAYATQSGGMNAQSVGGAPPLHAWVPPSPQEQQYYDMLFSLVDDQRRNAIGGQLAVAFFTRSHVDKSILREVWNIADSQRRSELSRNEFYVAMRLISMAQRGEQVSVHRFFQFAMMQYPLPMMEGVTPPPQGVQQQQQQQQQTQQQDFGSMHQPPANSGGVYAVTADEKSKYDVVFQQYDTDRDGFLMGAEAVALFQMSGLDRNVLRDIWSMADVTQDSKLSIQEFYVAMHLIVCVSKRGLPMPPTLPRELGETAFGVSGGAQDGFGSQMSGPPSQNGIPVQQQESVPPPKPEGMSAFDSLSTAEDAPLPSLASSTPRSDSFSHAGANTSNSHTGGFGEPTVPTPTGSLHGDFSAPAVQQDFGSFAPSRTPSVTSGAGRERTNSASSMNSMSSFSGMAPLPPQQLAHQLPPRSLGSNERIQIPQAENVGFQAPTQSYASFGAGNFNASPAPVAAPEKLFMGDEEEKRVVSQLDQQNEQVVQVVASVERKQTAIEMISEKLHDLDELRHELVTLVMKREDIRATSSSTFAASDNSAEEQSRHAVERALQDLVENQKQLIHQLQCDILKHESELEEAVLSAKLQQKLSLESRSPMIDAESPPLSRNDSLSGGGKGFAGAPLSLDGSNALSSPVAAPSAPSISAFSPDATDSSGFNAFSNFDSAPRSIASATPSPAAAAPIPSSSAFSPSPSPSQSAGGNDNFDTFGDFAAAQTMDTAPSPLADIGSTPGKSPFSPTPSPAAVSDNAGFEDAPANSPFSPFSPAPSPAAADVPGNSPFSPVPSPAAAASTSTDFAADPSPAPESSPFSTIPPPATTETPEFDAFATAPLSNDSAATPASTTVATENLIFSPVAADNGKANTFGDFEAAPVSTDSAPAPSEPATKIESTGNLLFSPTPSPAAATTPDTSGFDSFGDFSAPVSTDNAASASAPEKTTGNSPFSPVAVDSSSDFNSFGDFNSTSASADSIAPPSTSENPAEASGNSSFSPVAVTKTDSKSNFEAFGDFDATPVPTDNTVTSAEPAKAADAIGSSPFSPVSNDNNGGFEAFGDFNAAPTSTDNATSPPPKEASGSNGFEAFGDFSAAPAANSEGFGDFGSFH